ncbi:hypothetical protein HAX54_000884 [Datura stramonium]|uniref:Uncharacterized protein n=1 Tax=Datura stramonium TaxID=4076 RepID=A0ABS8RSQ9_DATST|nr:hypothetical protein [Datura stramonium]
MGTHQARQLIKIVFQVLVACLCSSPQEFHRGLSFRHLPPEALRLSRQNFVFDALAMTKLKDKINSEGKSNAPSSEHALGNFWIPKMILFGANQELNELLNLLENTIRERDTSVGVGKANIDDIYSVFVNNHSEVADKRRRGEATDIYVGSSLV